MGEIDIDLAVMKTQVAEIREDVKLLVSSLGVTETRYHALCLSLEKSLPQIADNKKRLDKLEPIVLLVAAIPVVLGGLWALVQVLIKVLPLISLSG